MTEEQKKEIVKAAFYGHTTAEIAENEEVSEEEVNSTIARGRTERMQNRTGRTLEGG